MDFWPPSLNPEHSLPSSPPSPRLSMNHSARHLFSLTAGLLLMVVNPAMTTGGISPSGTLWSTPVIMKDHHWP